MSYKMLLPPKQDEVNAVVKSLYVCECQGCGIVHERKAKFCADHATAPQRVETISEYKKLQQK